MPNPKQKPRVSYSGDDINFRSLLEFIRQAQLDLEAAGDDSAALRFEILYEYLTKDFRGGYLKYTSKALGL